MEGLAATTTAHTGIAPPYWIRMQDASGQTVLSYAVRGGKAKRVLGLLGGACIAAGAWGAYWLLSGGGLTLAGVVLLVLVPGGLVAFGAHCLDTVFWARRDYLLGARGLISRRYPARQQYRQRDRAQRHHRGGAALHASGRLRGQRLRRHLDHVPGLAPPGRTA